EPIADKTILLHSEQGFGDTIQFCRYASLVAERGARVLLEVPKSLQGLMSGVAGVQTVIVKGNTLPEFDLHCPLLSLPSAFGTTLESIPAKVPYLQAPSSHLLKWLTRLGAKHGPRVGLAWSGRPTHMNDRNRSMALIQFLPMFDMEVT